MPVMPEPALLLYDGVLVSTLAMEEAVRLLCVLCGSFFYIELVEVIALIILVLFNDRAGLAVSMDSSIWQAIIYNTRQLNTVELSTAGHGGAVNLLLL